MSGNNVILQTVLLKLCKTRSVSAQRCYFALQMSPPSHPHPHRHTHTCTPCVRGMESGHLLKITTIVTTTSPYPPSCFGESSKGCKRDSVNIAKSKSPAAPGAWVIVILHNHWLVGPTIFLYSLGCNSCARWSAHIMQIWTIPLSCFGCQVLKRLCRR